MPPNETPSLPQPLKLIKETPGNGQSLLTPPFSSNSVAMPNATDFGKFHGLLPFSPTDVPVSATATISSNESIISRQNGPDILMHKQPPQPLPQQQPAPQRSHSTAEQQQQQQQQHSGMHNNLSVPTQQNCRSNLSITDLID
jgi:hypothetical protein